jgi:hypothetical protein
MGGRGKQISEFEASLVYSEGEFQDSQGYTEKPCLENHNNNNKKENDILINARIPVFFLGCIKHYFRQYD